MTSAPEQKYEKHHIFCVFSIFWTCFCVDGTENAVHSDVNIQLVRLLAKLGMQTLFNALYAFA